MFVLRDAVHSDALHIGYWVQQLYDDRRHVQSTLMLISYASTGILHV